MDITLDSIMTKLYSFCYDRESKGYPVKSISDLPDDLFFHSDVHYAKAALEARFSPKRFTLAEVKELIESTFYEETIKLPEWYEEKWLRNTQALKPSKERLRRKDTQLRQPELS